MKQKGFFPAGLFFQLPLPPPRTSYIFLEVEKRWLKYKLSIYQKLLGDSMEQSNPEK